MSAIEEIFTVMSWDGVKRDVSHRVWKLGYVENNQLSIVIE